MSKLTVEEVISRIVDVNARSARATEINIFELETLNELVSKDAAEQIRKEFAKFDTPIKQIANFRKFTSWTANAKVAQNLAVKFVPPETYKITNEILIFDETVAVYRVKPDPFYLEVTDLAYADSMRNLFRNVWDLGDSLLMASDGSTQTKQYLPISCRYKNTPVVIYPAKDDGLLEKAFSRHKHGDLEKYVDTIIGNDAEFYEGADMILAYLWNQDETPYCDIWKIDRNDISDDSGFLYDVRVYKNHTRVMDMGVASGNSSIVLTAEELLMRELVVAGGLSFTEAADRSKYQARFPIGFVPAENFYV